MGQCKQDRQEPEERRSRRVHVARCCKPDGQDQCTGEGIRHQLRRMPRDRGEQCGRRDQHEGGEGGRHRRQPPRDKQDHAGNDRRLQRNGKPQPECRLARPEQRLVHQSVETGPVDRPVTAVCDLEIGARVREDERKAVVKCGQEQQHGCRCKNQRPARPVRPAVRLRRQISPRNIRRQAARSFGLVACAIRLTTRDGKIVRLCSANNGMETSRPRSVPLSKAVANTGASVARSYRMA